jgi:hypothetical protein
MAAALSKQAFIQVGNLEADQLLERRLDHPCGV